MLGGSGEGDPSNAREEWAEDEDASEDPRVYLVESGASSDFARIAVDAGRAPILLGKISNAFVYSAERK